MQYSYLYKWIKKFNFLMIVACVISGVLTVRGIRLFRSEGFFEAWTQPVMLASLSVLGAIVAWQFIFYWYPRSSPERRNQLLAIAVILVFFLMATSTFYSAFGMSADKAMIRHMNDVSEKAEETLGEQYRKRLRESALIGPLEDMSLVFGSIVQREIEGGSLSGRRGTGRVSSTIKGLQDGYKNAAESLKKQGIVVERKYKKGAKTIEGIRAVISDAEMSVDEKSLQMQKRLGDLNAILAQMQTSALSRVESLVERLDELYLGNGDKKTEKAIAAIKTSISESKEAVLEKLADLQTVEEVHLKSFRMMDKYEAIVNYWGYVLPAFCYSLAADLLIPAFALFCLTFISYRGEKNHSRKKEQDSGVRSQPREPVDIRVAERIRQIYRESEKHQSRGGSGVEGGPPSPN